MPIFTIKGEGRELDIEAADEASALTGAQRWYEAATKYKAPNGNQNPSSSGVSLNIAGKNVKVSDDFLKLSVEQQNETIDDIAKELGLTGKTDTSYTGAIQQGVSNLVGGVGKTLKEYVAPEAGKAVQAAGQSIADPKYKSAAEEFSNPADGADKHFLGRAWAQVPRVLMEQAPGIATDVLATMALKKLGPAAQIAGGLASHMLRTSGDEAQRRAAGRTGDANAEPTVEDKAIGLGSSAAQAALNQFGISKIIRPAKFGEVGVSGVSKAIGNTGKAAAVEGITEAAQEGISQAASTAGTKDGLRIDPNAVFDAGVFGAAGGGAFSAPKAAKDATTAARFRDTGNEFAPYSAGVANRILNKVDGDASNLQSASKAFKAVSDTQADVLNELSQTSSFMRKRGDLDTEADNAVSRALQGRDLSKTDLEAIDRTEADDLKALAKQASVLSRLTSKGNFDKADERFSGGIAERVRKFVTKSPLTAGGAYAGGNALTHGLDALAVNAASNALPALGAYTGVRAAERALGITAPARTFVEKFADPNVPVRPVKAAEPSSAPQSTSVPSSPYRAPAKPWGDPEPVANTEADAASTLDDGIANIVQDLRIKKLAERLTGLEVTETSEAPPLAPEASPFKSAAAATKLLNRQQENERQASYAGLSDADVRDLAVQEAVDAGVIGDDPISRARYGQGVIRKRDLIREAVHKAATSVGYTDADVEAFQPYLRRLMIARTRQDASDILNEAYKAVSFNAGHALNEQFSSDILKTIWRK